MGSYLAIYKLSFSRFPLFLSTPALLAQILLAACLLILNSPSTQADESESTDKLLSKQRLLFKEVNKDLERGSTVSFAEHHDLLKTYPLYAYLQYTLISRDLKLDKQGAVDYFLDNFADVPAAKTLRKHWLQNLYKKQHWQQFITYYRPDIASTGLQCQYQYAHYKSGRQDESLAAALSLWTAGQSQPSECDPLFKLLIDNQAITESVAWRRYTRAVLNHEFQLANYIADFFVTDAYKNRAKIYLATDRDPSRVGDYANLNEHADATLELIEHSIAQLALQHPLEAMKHWARYRQSHPFDDSAQARLLPHLVKGLYQQNHGDIALSYLSDNITLADTKLLEWQLRNSLRDNDWLGLRRLIAMLPEPIRTEERWRYWQARVLLMTGSDAESADQAKTIFRELSRFRSYYGFLSSDRVGNSYRMADRPLMLKTADINALAKQPALQRIQELFYHGENLSARREWYTLTKDFEQNQWLVAAQLAHEQKWHQLAILAMANAQYWDDIDIRFPLPYREDFEKQAASVDLPLHLLFAISRQESAFAVDVTSPAGARGLMQLMPPTAKQVAKKHKIAYDSPQLLFDSSTNIALGSHYYKDMMLRFGGNRILATASYNAGPHRVDSWRKATAGKLPYDVWIELIPFSETRQYVQNVLTYSVIFAHHLEQNQPILSPLEKQQLL